MPWFTPLQAHHALRSFEKCPPKRGNPTRLPPSKRKAALEVYLHEVVRTSFPILSYDESAARWHAFERVRLEGAGIPQPFVDGQIAAIAHANELVLVTANTKDFRHYSGLRLEDWTRKQRGAR